MDDEEKLLEEATKKLREKDRALRKKYGFESSLTFFDADELALQLRDAVVTLKREDGQLIFVTAIPNYKDPEGRICLTPDMLIELFFLPKPYIESMIVAGHTLGFSGHEVLSAPGLEEMKKYCVKLTELISDVAVELKKKKKIERIFEKLFAMLGGEIEGKKDLLVQRVKYYRDVCDLFAKNRNLWKPEMVRLGLINK